MKFIRTVVNMSFSNLQDFKEFGEDVTLMKIDMEDLIKRVSQSILRPQKGVPLMVGDDSA
jgi:hypothetical protein